MASEAEVDLLISTAGALPELERDLSRIVRQAENDADAIDLDVALDARQATRVLDAELTTAIRRAEGNIDGIEVGVLIEQRDAVRELTGQLSDVIQDVQRGEGVSNPVAIQAVLDAPRSIRNVGSELRQVVANIQATAPEIEIETVVDRDSVRRIPDLTNGLTALGRTARTTAQGMGILTGGVAALSLSVSAVVPLLASLTAAATELAPAAAVGTTALLSMTLAAGTLSIAMIGVGDAIEQAFDPEAKPEELQKSLEKLAPEARKFVLTLQDMRGALKEVQQGVQNRVFQDLDESLASLGRVTGPVVTTALNQTANALNNMAEGAVEAANGLSASGVLGQALDGATQGLTNLEPVPGRVLTSFTLLAAGAAPAFDRITKKIDEVALRIQEKLIRSLDDGSLENAINNAVSTFGQLFDIVGNFGEGVGNIFGGLTQNGRGLFDILEDISEAFEELTASEEFQTILNELAKTADTLVSEILPLLKEAFVVLGPVIEELAPLIREFAREIGPELIPLIQELGPVLLDIVEIIREQLPFAIEFTKAAIETLTFVLKLLHGLLDNVIIPIVREVADVLDSELVKGIAAASRFITSNLPGIGRRFEEMKDASVRAVTTMTGRALAKAIELKDGFVRTFGALVNDAVAFVKELPGRVVSAISNLAADMQSIGRNAALGFARGLAAGAGDVFAAARNIANSVTDTIAGALDIRSPSRKTRKQGREAGTGLALGIKDSEDKVKKAAESAGRAVNDSFGKSLQLSDPLVDFFDNFTERIGVAIGDAFTGTIDVAGPLTGFFENLQEKIGETIASSLTGRVDVSKTVAEFLENLDNAVGRAAGERITPGRIDSADPILNPNPVSPFTLTGEGTSVVQVFIGNELVDQHIDNRFRQAQSAQERRISQGIRI